jgi:D-alanyl-D-alanine carboxypeptidase
VAGDLDAALEDFASSADLPGVAAAVLTEEGGWQGTFGSSAAATTGSIDPDAEFAIGSITKTFVAALVLREVERGQVELDAPLSDYLPPGLAAVSNRATVRRALSHQSGIAEYVTRSLMLDALSDCARTWTLAEIPALIPASSERPGVFRYSNSNYILLGLALEHVTDTPIGELVRTMLHPYELSRIVYQPSDPPSGSRAHPHIDADGDGQWDELAAGDGAMLPCQALATVAGPAGGMASDAASLARWGWLLYGGSILPPPLLAQMTTGSYGLGSQRFDLLRTSGYGHGGSIPGYASLLVVVPDAKASVTVLVNADRFEVLRGLASRLLEAATH